MFWPAHCTISQENSRIRILKISKRRRCTKIRNQFSRKIWNIFKRIGVDLKRILKGFVIATGVPFCRLSLDNRYSGESSSEKLLKLEMELNNQSINRDGLFLRSEEARSPSTASSDFGLQWGNRKRIRGMKSEVKDRNGKNGSASLAPVQRTSARVDRRVIRSDTKHNVKDSNPINGYSNLRQRPASPSHRILRNSESSISMRGQSNGTRKLSSPDSGEGGKDKKRTVSMNNSHRHHHQNNNGNHRLCSGSGGSASSETAAEGKKGGSSSGGSGIPAVWPPKFVIALTNQEKEEDFMAIKGSKLPQRPKKRAKFIQRSLNLVSPGAWLCDLTLERYEVREKKVSKKRPRGLRAMGNIDSDSE
ncbi:unnamed protein product [Fraxinus pennsylvanica]|uniref:Uncharacterized protein n=1 Tax=Fraxinus pennsylvanica TaxID=56036 RepID=A0AAD1ZL17_9LAMI|nr:unnamed protein product [Fraxinus pennsylvanica]